MPQTVKDFMSHSISFHEPITVVSVATTFYARADMGLSFQLDILTDTPPTRRPYHVVSKNGKKSLPLM
jgi:hypothetical protein